MQLHKTEDNVVIFCKNGRTRAPIYLVAYLILCYDMTVMHARGKVHNMLYKERHHILDGDNRLLSVLESLV